MLKPKKLQKGGHPALNYADRIKAKEVTDKNKNIDWVKRGIDVANGKVDWKQGNSTHLMESFEGGVPYKNVFGTAPSIGPKGESKQPIWFDNAEDRDAYAKNGLIPHYQNGKNKVVLNNVQVSDNTRVPKVDYSLSVKKEIHPPLVRKWLDISLLDTIEQDDRNKKSNDLVKYTESTLNSPMYKKRLERQIKDGKMGGNSGFIIDVLKSNLQSARHSIFPPTKEDYAGGIYDSLKHTYSINYKDKNRNPNESTIHELSHSTTRGEEHLINPETFNKNYKSSDDRDNEYFSSPTEIKARLDVARYFLNKNSKTNPNLMEIKKSDVDFLEKNKSKSTNINDLFEIFNNDKSEILRLLNRTAMNETNPKFLAKQGGQLNHLSEIDKKRKELYDGYDFSIPDNPNRNKKYLVFPKGTKKLTMKRPGISPIEVYLDGKKSIMQPGTELDVSPYSSIIEKNPMFQSGGVADGFSGYLGEYRNLTDQEQQDYSGLNFTAINRDTNLKVQKQPLNFLGMFNRNRNQVRTPRFQETKMKRYFQQGGVLQVNGKTGQPETIVHSGARIFSREHTAQLLKTWQSGDANALGELVLKIYNIQEKQKPEYTNE